jgi:hypothetical protein
MKMTVETPKKETKRKVRHIHVSKLKNGYEVSHEMEPALTKGGQNMSMGYTPPPPSMGFNGNGNMKKAHKQMLAHVADLAAQMHDMPESQPETEQAESTGAASAA